MFFVSKRGTTLNPMKNLIVLFVLTLPLMSSAQRPEHREHKEPLTAEQRATLHAKKMQLALALTELQTERLVEIFKKNQPPSRPNKKEERSSEDRYKMQLEQLKRQIVLQEEVKVVLNEEQFTAWKKIRQSRNPKMANRGKRLKSAHPPLHKKKGKY